MNTMIRLAAGIVSATVVAGLVPASAEASVRQDEAPAAVAAATAHRTVELGRRQSGTRGYGHAHPKVVDNGGDPAGIAFDLHWKHWGAARATARGKTYIFKPNGGYYAKPGVVELRAVAIRTCAKAGGRAYTRLEGRVVTKPGGHHWTSWGSWWPDGKIC